MDTINWKILSLLAVTLLVALGLQASAIKIMMNLAAQSAPPASTASAAREQATGAQERGVVSEQPPAPIQEAKPAALVADPPHLAGLAPKPEPTRSEPSPEVSQPPVAAPPMAASPSAEAALVAAEAKVQPGAGGHAASPPVAAAPRATPAQEAKPATPTPSSTETKPSPERTGGGALQESDWLRTRNPKHYTVQLYSGKDLDTLKEIAGATASDQPQAYYSTGSRSGAWYSLVAGDYPDSAAAQAAAAQLTDRLPALKPWIRRFDEIQAKMLR